MSVHIQEIHDAISKAPTKNWTTTLEKIKNQMLLRALTCIQLANKMTSNNSVLTLFY